MFPRPLLFFVVFLFGSVVWADEEDPAEGHSVHGEAFNEGPRQAGQLIEGLSPIEFATSTKSSLAQQFFLQGVAQLHGFWYLEAERSFRQAVAEDPDMAIAYWGMAMANANNHDRARGMIDEAMSRREKHADERERGYIEALDKLIKKEDDETSKEARRQRAEKYIAGLEKILNDYPNDVEAKAFLTHAIWAAQRDGVKITSRYVVEALLKEIFESEPMHPAHHYRIHLWDSARPENSLQSAAACGPSSPAIAHMWHMPGHIYSNLKRYGDAVWQQEASARVDHAHMIQTRLMPDQIHNFAHNNEWLVRNLLYVGRVDDALDLSRNLLSLPRHPDYNSMAKVGSYRYGRQRLIQTLTQYGLWDELLRENESGFWTSPDDVNGQEDWLGWLAVAQFQAKTGKPAEGIRILQVLKRSQWTLQGELLDLAEGKEPTPGDPSQDGPSQDGPSQDEPSQDDARPSDEPDSREEIQRHIETLRTVIARVHASAAARRKQPEKVKRHAKVAKLDPLIHAQWLSQAGDESAAIEIAEKEAEKRQHEVRPLAILVDSLWRNDQKDVAKEKFERLRTVAAKADLETPMLARLRPIADAMGIDHDWRHDVKPASDLGERPDLEQLGPFRWTPSPVESWSAKTDDGTAVTGDQFDGRARLIVFYLGFGCLHCIEQLHAIEPEVDAFADLGIEVVAISTESVEELSVGLESFGKAMPIPLLSDGEMQSFKRFGCWDDFESQPLHGTFLIDANNRVRWQDIGHEPFMDVKFLLEESRRLLELP